MSGAYAKQPARKILDHDPFCAVDGCARPYYAKHYCRLHWERQYATGTVEASTRSKFVSVEERLRYWSKRVGDCLIWTGYVRSDGYGGMTVNGKYTGAHRVAYEVTRGPIPDGLVVRHKCDTPLCIEPSHLEVGTQADNSRDKVERGRSTFGERNGGHKLKEREVLEIIAHLENGERQRDLARMYGVGQSTIGRIARRESWGYLWRRYESAT